MKAIITYKYKSHGVCGNTIGADGSGEYGYILEGEFEKLYEKIKELYDTVLSNRGVSDVVCVVNEERYSGFPIKEIKV